MEILPGSNALYFSADNNAFRQRGKAMTPTITTTTFGSITIEGQEYPHDVLIRLDGSVRKRKKKLSKEVFGTSHIISRAEAKYFYEKGAEMAIIGTGQNDQVRLSKEAKNYLEKKEVQLTMASTPEAIQLWNKLTGKAIGLFHVTC